MKVSPELDPDVEDQAPAGDGITPYDEQHYVTYLRLLDADADGADWTEVVRIVLHRDPLAEEIRTRRRWGEPSRPSAMDDEDRLSADTRTGGAGASPEPALRQADGAFTASGTTLA